jgi:hypothetical protein
VAGIVGLKLFSSATQAGAIRAQHPPFGCLWLVLWLDHAYNPIYGCIWLYLWLS